MASRITVLALAAGLGLAGGAVLLETLPTASSGPSGRVRPAAAPATGPPPFTNSPLGFRENLPPDDAAGTETSPTRGEDIPSSGDAEVGQEVGPQEEGESIEIRLKIRGTVVEASGFPIQGAEVRLCGGRAVMESDEEGAFALECSLDGGGPQDPEEVLLEIDAAGFVSTKVRRDAADLASPPGGGFVDLGRIVLRRGVTIEVRVVDGAENPVKGAPILSGGAPPEGQAEGGESWMQANEEGRCWLVDMDPDRSRWFQARAFGVQSEVLDLRGVVREGEYRVETLVLPGIVGGTLRVRTNLCLRDAQILVDSDAAWTSEDEDGSRVVSLPAGVHAIEIRDEEGATLHAESIEVHPARESVVEFGQADSSPEEPPEEPPAEKPGLPWACGVVEDDLGRPVAGAWMGGPSQGRGIRLPWEGRTDAQGGFRIQVYPGGGRLFNVEAFPEMRFFHFVEGTPEQWDLLRSGQSICGLRIVVPRPASIEGTVRDGDGRPASGARVGLFEAPWSTGPGPLQWGTTDPDGRYRIRGVDTAAGLWLRAERRGSVSTTLPVLGDLRPGETSTRDLVIRPIRRIPLEVRAFGLRPGWRVEVEGKVFVSDGPVLTVPVSTGFLRAEVQTLEGLPLQEILDEIPETASSHRVTLDFTDDPWRRRVASGGH